MRVELGQLDQKYSRLRGLDPQLHRRLMASIAEHQQRLVDIEGYVTLHTNRYSVPEQLIHRNMQVHETKDRVRIFNAHDLVADHPLEDFAMQKRRTMPEHRRKRRPKQPLEPTAEHHALCQKAVEALLDRLRHHCHTLRIDGPSLREPILADKQDTRSVFCLPSTSVPDAPATVRKLLLASLAARKPRRCGGRKNLEEEPWDHDRCRGSVFLSAGGSILVSGEGQNPRVSLSIELKRCLARCSLFGCNLTEFAANYSSLFREIMKRFAASRKKKLILQVIILFRPSSHYLMLSSRPCPPNRSS